MSGQDVLILENPICRRLFDIDYMSDREVKEFLIINKYISDILKIMRHSLIEIEKYTFDFQKIKSFVDSCLNKLKKEKIKTKEVVLDFREVEEINKSLVNIIKVLCPEILIENLEKLLEKIKELGNSIISIEKLEKKIEKIKNLRNVIKNEEIVIKAKNIITLEAKVSQLFKSIKEIRETYKTMVNIYRNIEKNSIKTKIKDVVTFIINNILRLIHLLQNVFISNLFKKNSTA